MHISRDQEDTEMHSLVCVHPAVQGLYESVPVAALVLGNLPQLPQLPQLPGNHRYPSMSTINQACRLHHREYHETRAPQHRSHHAMRNCLPSLLDRPGLSRHGIWQRALLQEICVSELDMYENDQLRTSSHLRSEIVAA